MCTVLLAEQGLLSTSLNAVKFAAMKSKNWEAEGGNGLISERTSVSTLASFFDLLPQGPQRHRELRTEAANPPAFPPGSSRSIRQLLPLAPRPGREPLRRSQGPAVSPRLDLPLPTHTLAHLCCLVKEEG